MKAEDISSSHRQIDSDEDNIQFLTFKVGTEEYGVDIMTVREIKGWSETTRLPNTPSFMRGVINLRGAIIPIFDLRTRFGQGVTEASVKHVVIILAAGPKTIGILVDAVSDILNTGKESMQPAPSHETGLSEKFVTGLVSVEGRMVVILDVEKIFDTSLLEEAVKIAEEI